jgi:hypothetical protein
MAIKLDPGQEHERLKVTDRSRQPVLSADFSRRLELSLQRADRERRRHLLFMRLRSLLPLVLLVGPVVGWRLMLATPDGVHVGINVIAWITFALDIGVHLDGSLLSALGLQALPTVVGALLLIVVAATLLYHGEEEG